MTAVEILAAIRESIDFLATRHRDIPERHRSMRAVFDQSWRLLEADAQQIFAQLSIFRGGFSPDAAAEIIGTNRIMLGLLQDRSLIHRLTTGRYEMRPLLREYAAERYDMLGMVRHYAADRLDDDQKEKIGQAHAVWYLRFMAEQKSDLMGAKPWDAIERIELEIENVRQGWQTACDTLKTAVGQRHASAGSRHAIDPTQIDILLKAAEPLSEYYNIRGRFQEALDMFSQAAKAAKNNQQSIINNQLSTDSVTDYRLPTTDQLVAHAKMHKTRFLVRLGQYKDGVESGKQAVRLARTADDAWCAAMGHVWWCQAFWEQGLTQEALDVLEKGERFREKAKDRYLDGRFSHQYSVVYSIQGNSQQALEKSKLAIKVFSSIKSVWHEIISLNTLGIIFHERGEFNEAQKIYEQINAIIRPKFVPAFFAMIQNNLANALQRLEMFTYAHQVLDRTLLIYQNMGLHSRELAVYTNLASLFFNKGDLDSAYEHAHKAVTLSSEFSDLRFESLSLVTMGDVLLKREEFKLALNHYLHAAEISDQHEFQQIKAEILFGISQCFIGPIDTLRTTNYTLTTAPIQTG